MSSYCSVQVRLLLRIMKDPCGLNKVGSYKVGTPINGLKDG